MHVGVERCRERTIHVAPLSVHELCCTQRKQHFQTRDAREAETRCLSSLSQKVSVLVELAHRRYRLPCKDANHLFWVDSKRSTRWGVTGAIYLSV